VSLGKWADSRPLPARLAGLLDLQLIAVITCGSELRKLRKSSLSLVVVMCASWAEMAGRLQVQASLSAAASELE